MQKMTRSEAGRLGALKTEQVLQDRYSKNKKKCTFCLSELPYEKRRNRFCDRSCAASHNNSGKRKHGVASVSGNCPVCGLKVEGKQFCSRACVKAAQWNELCSLIDKTKILPSTNCKMYGYTPKVAKRYLSEKRGRKCEICNLTEWQGVPIPLILDHIDGNSSDHRIINLRLVCGNCNMLLPTFAGKNRGNGRSWRYKDGARQF